MFVRRKKNRSGIISVVIVDKHGGKFKELHTVGIGSTPEDVADLCHQGRVWIKIISAFRNRTSMVQTIRVMRSSRPKLLSTTWMQFFSTEPGVKKLHTKSSYVFYRKYSQLPQIIEY